MTNRELAFWIVQVWSFTCTTTAWFLEPGAARPLAVARLGLALTGAVQVLDLWLRRQRLARLTATLNQIFPHS